MSDKNQLFTSQISDLRAAQDYIIQTVPEMLPEVVNDKTEGILMDLLLLTKNLRKTLTEIHALLVPGANSSTEISGLVKDMIMQVEEYLNAIPEKKSDKHLLNAAHRMAIYEVASYVTLHNYADELDHWSEAEVFRINLEDTFRIAERIKDLMEEWTKTGVI